jgi:hypothetical protein
MTAPVNSTLSYISIPVITNDTMLCEVKNSSLRNSSLREPDATALPQHGSVVLIGTQLNSARRHEFRVFKLQVIDRISMSEA